MITRGEQMLALRRSRMAASPPFFRGGFRPFFFGGAAWAVIALALWLVTLAGDISLPTAFAPLAWHRHEMLFGFVGAIISGFLLTAIPNWTGRLPIAGTAARRSVRALGLGTGLGPVLRGHRPGGRRRARRRLLSGAGGPGGARGRRREEPQRADRRHGPVARNCQCARPCGRGGIAAGSGSRRARRDRAGGHDDLADRRAHHPLLHPQLDGEAGDQGPASDPADALRHGRPGDHCDRPHRLDRDADIGAMPPSPCWRRAWCRRRGSRAGAA